MAIAPRRLRWPAARRDNDEIPMPQHETTQGHESGSASSSLSSSAGQAMLRTKPRSQAAAGGRIGGDNASLLLPGRGATPCQVTLCGSAGFGSLVRAWLHEPGCPHPIRAALGGQVGIIAHG